MRIRDKKHYGDPETLKRLKDEADFIGRRSAIVGDCLIVYALQKPRKQTKPKHDKQQRDKRREKFERRPHHGEE